MKTVPFTKILFLFALIAIVSCSKKEDPVGLDPEDFNLILTSDAGNEELQIIQEDQMVTFTVTGSDGEDYTSVSKIFVNDTEIPGASHTFSEMGEFQVKAAFEGDTTNILNFQVLAETERALTIDVIHAMNDQPIDRKSVV